MRVFRNMYSTLLGNPEAERHLDLFLDLRIILKWVVSDRNFMSWWRMWFAVVVTGFWVCRYGAAVVQTGRCVGNELVCIGPTLVHACCAAPHTCSVRPGNTAV